MKTAKQLKEERALKLQAYEDWLKTTEATLETEKRDLNADELARQKELLDEVEAFNPLIEAAERHERTMALAAGVSVRKGVSEKENKELQNYSFLRAIRSQLPNGKLEGLEREMHEEALREARTAGLEITGVGIPSVIMTEKRDVSATTDSEGGYTVPTTVSPLIEGLTAKMVLKKLGAAFWTGLTGNVRMPKATAVTTAWEGEKDANADGSPTYSAETLTPNRIGAKIPIYKQLIMQTSPGVEKDLQLMIELAIASAVENAAIQGAGSANVPQGIINTTGIGSVVGGTDGAAPTWSHITKLEKEVAIDDADVGALAYLTNPQVRGKLKDTSKDSGSGIFVWPDRGNELNGYTAGVTTNVPSNLDKGVSVGVCSAIIFGNFRDLVIAQWGGMDVVVDPYTNADTAAIRLIVNSWWDVGIRRAVSFAAMLDALTT